MSVRRAKAAQHENHERWLVSYADFITLLFAFFVVMFASTQSDKQRAKAVSESVKEALEHGEFSAAISTVLGRGKHEASRPPVNADRVTKSENLTAPPGSVEPQVAPPTPPAGPAHPADLARSFEQLQHDLSIEISAGKIGVKLERRGLVISLREAAFFASGDDAVAPPSIAILAKVAAEIQGSTNPLRLEGHTDSMPIHNSRFRSNWELSTARAISMMELLRERFHLPPERMSVAGYAENAPCDTNETAEGRSHNRRVDLIVLSAEGERSEPTPVGTPAAEPRQPEGAAKSRL